MREGNKESEGAEVEVVGMAARPEHNSDTHPSKKPPKYCASLVVMLRRIALAASPPTSSTLKTNEENRSILRLPLPPGHASFVRQMFLRSLLDRRSGSDHSDRRKMPPNCTHGVGVASTLMIYDALPSFPFLLLLFIFSEILFILPPKPKAESVRPSE